MFVQVIIRSQVKSCFHFVHCCFISRELYPLGTNLLVVERKDFPTQAKRKGNKSTWTQQQQQQQRTEEEDEKYFQSTQHKTEFLFFVVLSRSECIGRRHIYTKIDR